MLKRRGNVVGVTWRPTRRQVVRGAELHCGGLVLQECGMLGVRGGMLLLGVWSRMQLLGVWSGMQRLL